MHGSGRYGKSFRQSRNEICFSNSEFHLVATCDLAVIKCPDHVGSIDILLRS